MRKQSRKEYGTYDVFLDSAVVQSPPSNYSPLISQELMARSAT